MRMLPSQSQCLKDLKRSVLVQSLKKKVHFYHILPLYTWTAKLPKVNLLISSRTRGGMSWPDARQSDIGFFEFQLEVEDDDDGGSVA